MAKISVALVGATGETGKSILNSLVQDGNFDVTLIVRPQSIEKAATKALASRGLPILPIDATIKVEPELLRPFDVIVSAVDNGANEDQSRLATAAKTAGVKRFVPCGFTTIAPPGSIMTIRDLKEESYNDILKLKLGYTFIDVGYWHQLSCPRVPSGKLDYAIIPLVPSTEFYGDGKAKNLLTDIRDIGRFVTRIIQDPRTLNKKVFTWADELSQAEMFAIVERLTGETIERVHVSYGEVEKRVAAARAQYSDPPTYQLYGAEYLLSKYVREDNTRANALYLGYLDARELYPDVKPISFEESIEEANAGKAPKLYEGRF